MNFEEILFLASQGDESALENIIEMYRPLLVRYSMVNGIFDEDLYQELALEVIKTIYCFNILEK